MLNKTSALTYRNIQTAARHRIEQSDKHLLDNKMCLKTVVFKFVFGIETYLYCRQANM